MSASSISQQSTTQDQIKSSPAITITTPILYEHPVFSDSSGSVLPTTFSPPPPPTPPLPAEATTLTPTPQLVTNTVSGPVAQSTGTEEETPAADLLLLHRVMLGSFTPFDLQK